MNVDLKEQYIYINNWGRLMLPASALPALSKALLVDTEYVDGRQTIKLKKDDVISFTMVPKDELAAAVAAFKLEG